ncbi:MAG: GNAT family N-acetyltransferase [Exilispira sp.]
MQKKKESLLNISDDIDILMLPRFFLNNLKVKIATEKDLELISNLENIIFENPWHIFDFNFFYSICNVRVIRLNRSIIGYSVYRFERGYGNKKNICHLLKIGVHPKFQNSGAGSKLLFEMFCSMRKAKSNIVYLEVRESNKNAIKFYENRGFYKSKIIDNYYENGEAAFLMIKN